MYNLFFKFLKLSDLRSYSGLKSQDVGKKYFFLRFLETRPLTGKFSNSVSKRFITSPIAVLCSNFAKFGGREIGKIVRCHRSTVQFFLCQAWFHHKMKQNYFKEF